MITHSNAFLSLFPQLLEVHEKIWGRSNLHSSPQRSFIPDQPHNFSSYPRWPRTTPEVLFEENACL